MFTGGSDDEAARIAAAAVPGASKSARRIPVMLDALPPVPATAARPGETLSSAAMSLEDYARVVQTRNEFVDFLLAPARGELAAAA
jgi:hypothetical protein